MDSNFNKWRSYMDWCISPDCYIDFGFYSLIGAALQRRVWAGEDYSPLYPNPYTIFTGEPGVGKGLVLKELDKILRHHKFDPKIRRGKIDATNAVAAAFQDAEYDRDDKKESDNMQKSRNYEKPLALPIGPNATTYQSLILRMADSYRSHPVPEILRKQGESGIYTHTSMCFCLEEISSLFRKKTEDLVNFLIQAYDCGDYTYETISRQQDRIRKCCLTFIGGTTPGFMQYVFNDQLLTEGFASRVFFIFATQNRKTQIRNPPLTTDQIQAHKDILEHIGKLIELYGPVKYTEEAWDYLDTWWKKAQHERPNTSNKLNPYYARKNIHVQKLAMALHFGESTEMLIGAQTFEDALKILAVEERKMHNCLGGIDDGPFAKVTKKIKDYICHNGSQHTFNQLKAEFWTAMPSREQDKDLQNVLEHLKATGQIDTSNGEKLGQPVLFYHKKKESAI